jgi:hypothetical protein
MTTPGKTESLGRGPRRGASAGDEGSAEEGAGEGVSAKTGMGDIIGCHRK